MHITGSIESLKRDRSGFKVRGEWYSNFPPKPLPAWAHERGVSVEFEYLERGGYKNIVDGTLRQVGEAPTGGSGGGGGNRGGGKPYNKGWHSYQDKEFQTDINRRITRQNALGNAVAVVSATLRSDEAIEDVLERVFTAADEMVAWVTDARPAGENEKEGGQNEASF